MCEFCLKHGEGKPWYLDARNYAEDLLSDLRRRKFIEHFFSSPDHLTLGRAQLKLLDRVPSILRRPIQRKITRRQKPVHFGQVVPIEDIERILDLTTSVVRVACICRHAAFGKETRACYGVSLAPEGGEFVRLIRQIDPAYLIGPPTRGLEVVPKTEALAQMREFERRGMCHTVWTFITPFIAGLCNCSLPGCMAMTTTLEHAVPVFFRSEYTARVDAATCTACGACVKLCPFQAFRPRAAKEKARIDPAICYGCGICRSICASGSIALFPRASDPSAAAVW
jgi:Pyruvate/2-oxoacid:ferredoxin oxidoreductase delta subunit